MNDSFQIMYVIVDKRGFCDPKTLSYYRKDCIKNFLSGSSLSWDSAKKIGWTCKKVDVHITASSNF